jgi:hypothetical protein
MYKRNKCKHILLPLPASPETAEELTAFARENKFCTFFHSENSVLHFPLRLFYLREKLFAFSREREMNKCKHILLPLPASPETAEELTAFSREKKFCTFFHSKNSVLHFLRVFSTLREIFFAFSRFCEKKNSAHPIIL